MEREKAGTLGIRIDRMGEAYLNQVIALERECGLNSRGIEGYRRALSDPRSLLLMAVSNQSEDGHEEIAGLLSSIVVTDELHIDNLAVARNWRRMGIASKLLVEGLREAYHEGAHHAILEVRSANAAAKALYEKSGFTVIGKRLAYYHDPPDDALVMAVDIVNSLAKITKSRTKKNIPGS
jgi:ribosomal-protein-alanine N-acetyltransferase